MSDRSSTERQWQVMIGAQRLGSWGESQLAREAAQGRLNPGALLSCGEGWLTVAEFMAQRGIPADPGGPPRPIAPQPAPPMPNPSRWIEPTEPARADLDAPDDDPGPPPLPPLPPIPGAMIAPHPAAPVAPAAAAPAVAPALAPIPPEYDGPPERDRIVILGRRQSGKTIYIASVYAKLWRNLDGLTAKALRGETHAQLMDVMKTLRQRDWPAPTLDNRQMEFELQENGRKRLMVALDYAGEMFAKAFIDGSTDIAEVKSLVRHIDQAAAVMMLVDPSIIAGADHRAAMEDDFGLVQAVQRIRNWPGGEHVPVVLVLTKVDRYQSLLDQYGGPGGFVRHHFPALMRLMKQIPIFQVSAVQVQPGPEGRLIPADDFTPMNIDNPLRYCLRQIFRAEQQAEASRFEMEQRAALARREREEQDRERRQNMIVAGAIVLIILLGVAAVVWILKLGS